MKTKKIKLLIATDSFLPRWDGVSRFLYETIPFLKQDFEITIICPDFSQKVDFSNKKEYDKRMKEIKIIKIPLTKITAGDYILPKHKPRLIYNQIKKNEIIFTNTIGPIGLQTMFFSRIQKKILVNYIHSIDWELFSKSVSRTIIKKIVYGLTKMITKIIYQFPDLLVFPSEEIARIFSQNKIYSPKTVVRLGIDTKTFIPFPEKTRKKLRKELKLSEKDFVIGYCGRIAREKDPYTLLNAFKEFSKKHSNAKLLVIGSGIKEIEEEFKKTNNTIFLGKQDDVVKYYNTMDVFCSTSLTETTGLTILEAMSSGLTVISTKVGIAKQIIKNNKNGFLIEKQDPNQIVKILNKLYRNKKKLKEIGKNARETVEKTLSIEETGEGIKKVLLSMLEQKNKEY